MPKFVLYQVVYHEDGTFKLNEIVACDDCGAMIPDQSKWWAIHIRWHESMEGKKNNE